MVVFFVPVSKHDLKPNKEMNIKPEIVIDSRPNDYQKNVDLLGRLIECVSGNENFVSPSPDIATLTSVLNSLKGAITASGLKGNRGGRAALLDLRAKSAQAYILIKAEVLYMTGVASIAAGSDMELMASILSTGGLNVRTEPHPQGLLGQVQNIHKVHSHGLSRNQVDWEMEQAGGSYQQKEFKIF